MQLAAAVAFFLTAAPLCRTEPTTGNSPGASAARVPEGFQLEVRRESVDLDLSDFDIEDVEVDYLEARQTVHCSNQGSIRRVKPEYQGKCNPANSVGRGSANNCHGSRGGRSYLCVQSNQATCYVSSTSQAQKAPVQETVGQQLTSTIRYAQTARVARTYNFENGECFI